MCAVQLQFLISTDKPQDSGEDSKPQAVGKNHKPQDGGEESKVSTDTIDTKNILSLNITYINK